jgi:hypothetical protein
MLLYLCACARRLALVPPGLELLSALSILKEDAASPRVFCMNTDRLR